MPRRTAIATVHPPTSQVVVENVRTRLRLTLAATMAALAAPMLLAPGANASFGAASDFATPYGPVSVAVGDFTGDGDPDLAVANSGDDDPESEVYGPGGVSILPGQAGGSFGAPTSFATGAFPTSVAAGDFNGDLRLDLAVTHKGVGGFFELPVGGVSVLLNTGGGFAAPVNIATGFEPTSVAVGDFNGDSDPDLAVANESAAGGNGSVSVLLGGADGSFGAATNFAVGVNPVSVAAGDFNGDSDPDLAVANAGGGFGTGGSVSVLLGGTQGSFGAATNHVTAGATSVAVGDFNGDSDPDLAVADGTGAGVGPGNVLVLLGGAGGGFGAATAFPVGVAPTSVAIGDFNSDADPDLAVTNYYGDSVSVLHGEAGGGFGAATNHPLFDEPVSVAVGDFNGDSRRDLAVANYSPYNAEGLISVLLNTIDSPQITDTDPDPPANNNNPQVKGSGAEPNSTVRLYSNRSCTSAVLGIGSATEFNGAAGITATVPADQATNMWATATDQAGNASSCSIASFPYTEDSTTAAPAITDTDPNSPADDNLPEVKGSAEAGSTVRLYTTPDCSGSEVASGSASLFANPGLTVNVPSDSTTSFRATATDPVGNVSPCSAPLVYVEDSTLPTAPTITDTDPDSPADDNNPLIKGTAEAGSTVTIYRRDDCSGAEFAVGTASEFERPGLAVTETLEDDTTTSLHATATDQLGRTSGCSAAFVYVEDSSAPETQILTNPPNPSNDPTGDFTFSSNEEGVTFECSLDTGAFTPCTSPRATVTLHSGSHTFEVRAIDAVGHVDDSPASYSWTVDTSPPADPAITAASPASPANDHLPELTGTAEAGSTVKLYKDNSTCADPPETTGTAAAFTGAGITVAVASDHTTQLRVRAVDAAGNSSACSAPFAYTEDSSPPVAPSITDTDPDSPANDNSPEAKGTAEAGSTVKLYGTSDCSGTPLGTGPAASFNGAAGITAAGLAADQTTDLRATATDQAGNLSSCSDAFAYTEDSTSPAVPSITDTDPDSPASDTSPEVKGTLGGGDQTHVRLYEDDFACADPAGASGTVAAFTSVGITVTVLAAHTTQLRARAVDAAGNASSCSGTFAYTESSVDVTPPQTTITGKPPGVTSKSRAKFEFESSEPGSSFACKLDSKPFGPCTSPKTYRKLKPGRHKFQVRATDPVGNPDATSARYTWKVKP